MGQCALNVSGGTLGLQNANAFSQNKLTLNGGVLSETASNGLSGSAALAISSGSTLLSVANNYSGGTTISGGLLQLGNSLALGSGSLALSAGTLDLNSYGISVLALSGTAGTITDNSTKSSAPPRLSR